MTGSCVRLLRRSHRLLPAVFCVLVMAGDCLSKHVNIEFELTTVDDPSELQAMFKTPPPAAKTTTDKAIVGLGPSYISVQKGRQKTVYDLIGKRILRLDLARSRYIDESLYADLGFRVAELQNRLALGSVFAKTQGDKGKNPFDRFQVESLLAIAMPLPEAGANVPEIKTEEAGGTLTFLHDGQWAVRFTPSKLTVPEPAAGQFARFMAYECYIHPQIRHKIAETGMVPEKLEYRVRNPPHSYAVTWVFQKIIEVEKEDLPLGNEFKPADAADADGPLADVLAEFRKQKSTPTHESAEAFAKSSLAEKKYLDAMLALVECRLQTSDMGIVPLMRAIASHADEDPQLRLYVDGLLASNDPKTAAQALKAFDSIDRSSLKKGYVIDIARANILTTLRQPKEARDLFLEVLKKNPFIAGVYKDLGDLYGQAFQMPLAWKCWDTGRSINPNLPILQEVDKREQWLQEKQPDFFLSVRAK